MTDLTPIAVMGAGAIGSLFGALLARAGASVTLIGRRDHVDAIERDGLLLQEGQADARIRVAATTDMAAVAHAGLVLFCVKSGDTEEAARQMAPHLRRDAVILSLQNGVDNPERIRRHAAHRVVPGLVYVGANIPAPGTVRRSGGGELVIGETREFRGDETSGPLLRDLAALFEGAGLRVKISGDIEGELWTKLVMNCAYNAISALGESAYGPMAAVPEVRRVMSDAVEEVALVAKAKGVRLPGDIVDMALRLAETMPRTTSSTAQDIAKGKRTEIDHLNGYVVREGEALGIPTPVNRTLSALMKLLERSRAVKS